MATLTHNSLKYGTLALIPWLLSAMIVAGLVFSLHLLKQQPKAPKADLITRKIDVALPTPPPPPPPPIKTTSSSSEPSKTALNLASLGDGPSINYADKPTMTLPKVESLELPNFTIDAKMIQERLALDMPLLAVEKLDRVPQVVRQKYFPPPKSVRQKGVKRIKTQVELIIDQSGKPYIKRIVDPVYPEMEEVIRAWVSHAIFSKPKKDGRAVQAIYFYSINFNYGR